MRNLGNRSWTSEALQSGRDSTQGVQAAEKPKEQQSGGSMAGALLQERWALGEELGRGAYGQVVDRTSASVAEEFRALSWVGCGCRIDSAEGFRQARCTAQGEGPGSGDRRAEEHALMGAFGESGQDFNHGHTRSVLPVEERRLQCEGCCTANSTGWVQRETSAGSQLLAEVAGVCAGHRYGEWQVFRATDRQTGQVVAIKRISLSGVAADHLAKVMSEIELLKSLDHKNIVKYIGSFKTRQHLYIVLEYMDNGAISQIIKPNRFGVFPESVVAVYIAQVLQGLDYLHSQGVVHRDIKGANILTTKEGLVKLCDFGVSSKLSDEPQNARDSYHPDVVGTPYWMAPEVVEMTSVTAASDIWSVGCLMVEMLTGIPPYFDFQPMSALFHIVQDTHPPLPEGITQQGEDFLLKCFQKDAKDRPSAAELLQHEWVHQQRRTLRSTWRSGLAAGLGTAPAASAGKRSDAHESVSSVIKRILQVDGDSQRSEGMVADDHAVHKSLSTPMDPAGSAVPGSATANGRPGTLSLPAGIELADRSARPSSGPAPALAAAAHLPGRPRPATAGEVRAQAKGAGTAAAVEAGAADGIGLPSDSAGPTRAGYMLTAMASGVSGGVLVTPWSLYRTHPPAQLGSAPARADPEAASGSGRSIRDDLESWLRQATDMAVGQGSRPGQLSTMGGSSSRGTGASTGGSDSSGPTHGEDAAAGGTGSSDALDMTQRKRADLAEVRRLIVQLGCSRGSVGAGRTPQGVAATCSALGEVLKRSGGELLSLFMAEMGLVVLLELLQTQKDPDALAGVLELVNSLVAQDEVALEQLCMVGAVPAVMQFCGGKWRLDVRVQAARFLDQLCRRGSHTLQILISCRGLPVLVELVEANPATQMELMQVGVQGIWKVLQAAGPAAMNPLCRLLAAADLVPRLVACLAAVAHRWDGFGGIRNSSSSGRLRHSSSGGGRPPTSPEANSEREQLMGMMSATADLLLLLAHADGTVKLHLCSSTTLEWLFDKVMPLLPRPLQLKVLKTIKRLTTDPQVLDMLQVGGTIEKLVKMVREELKADTPSGLLLDLLLEALQALHNLLKLSRERQTHAARHGLVPQLAAIAQWNVDSENGKMSRRSGPAAVLTAGAAAERPKPTSVLLQAEQAGAPGTSDADKCAALHSLAQSLLCTLAHSTPETRQELWRAHGLDLILEMLAKEAWQIPALDALAAWMVEDVHRVEPKLRMQHSVRLLNVLFSSVAAGLAAHPSSGSAAAEHQSVEKAARLLDIFQRMLETPGASNLCVAVAESELPMTMVTILLIVRTLYEHYPRPKEFIVKFGVADALRKLRAGQASQLVQRRIDTFLSAFRINSVL